MVKLKKDTSDKWNPKWYAEDSKYFTDIYATKHHTYTVHYTLKEDAPKPVGAYYPTDGVLEHGLWKQKDVKEYIENLDANYEALLEKTQAEHDAKEKYWADRSKWENDHNIFYGASYEPKVGERLTLRSAKLNKNNTIGEYRWLVKEGDFYNERVNVEKVVKISAEQYDKFAVNLMYENEGIELGRGGNFSEDPELKNYSWGEVYRDPKLMEIYRNTALTNVTAIVADHRETLYVDASGHNYARYVMFK